VLKSMAKKTGFIGRMAYRDKRGFLQLAMHQERRNRLGPVMRGLERLR